MHTGKFKRFRFTVTLQEEYTFVITDYVCLSNLIFKHNTMENCEINKSSATEVYMRSGENFENNLAITHRWASNYANNNSKTRIYQAFTALSAGNSRGHVIRKHQ